MDSNLMKEAKAKKGKKPKPHKTTAGFPKGMLALPVVAAIVFLAMKLDLAGSGPEVGQRAPEIKGSIQDGSTVRLSDYRKKVICLDFWGDW